MQITMDKAENTHELDEFKQSQTKSENTKLLYYFASVGRQRWGTGRRQNKARSIFKWPHPWKSKAKVKVSLENIEGEVEVRLC